MFADASWQRCRTHFMTNLLSRVPRRAQPWVATMVRTIYQQPSPEEVHAQHARMVGMLDERFPQAAELLADVGPDILAFPAFPVATGGRSGRTTRRSASTRRSDAGLTWWASSRTRLRSGGSSEQFLAEQHASGRPPAAICPLLPPTSAISTAWRHR